MHDFPILYVEDEEYDVLFLKQAFAAADIRNPFKVVTDGQQATNYLAGVGVFSDRQQFPLPGLVLLDLKLPYRSGLEVLKWIREQAELKSLLVVIYTSSTQPKDIRVAYELGANGYLVKQGMLERLDQMVRALRDYWLIHNEPPCWEP
jgi:CheY-like chemotaxis protein